jgi:dolichyl-phosphate-mannose-protein mannosyltransferase
MEIIKKSLHWFNKWEYTWVCLLVVTTLILHFCIITHPPEHMFDEQYYVADAKSILHGDGDLHPEHPPLAKLFILAGISIFGDNPIGWRFFSIIFGTISIVLFYFICRKLEMSRRAASFATALLAFENLSFIQASIAMLDVYMVTLMFLGILLYLKRHYPLAGIAIALSTLAKLSGILIIPALIMHWLITRRDRCRHFAGFLLVIPTAFLSFMTILDSIIYSHLINPLLRIKTILTLSSSLTFASAKHIFLSRPWDWLFRADIIAYSYDPLYTAAISYTIWALIIPCVIYMFIKALKHCDAGLFGILWFAATYLLWIPISLITDRISFVYYFYPTVGAICIGIGLGLTQIIDFGKDRKFKWTSISIVMGYLVLHLITFIILSPFSWLSWEQIPFIKT